MQEQTASQYCKANGLKSLQQLSEVTNVSVQTLSNWWKSEEKNQLFKVVVTGASHSRT